MYYAPNAYNKLRSDTGLSQAKYDKISNNTEIIFYGDANNIHIKGAELNTYPGDHDDFGAFVNGIDFETGELEFYYNYKDKDSIVSAADIMKVQYLEATKYAGKEFMLPKSFRRESLTNDMAIKVLDTYKYEYLSDDFFHDFMYNTDNGRSSLRISDSFGLKVNSISVMDNEMDSSFKDVRMFLELKSNLANKLQLPPRNLFRHHILDIESPFVELNFFDDIIFF